MTTAAADSQVTTTATAQLLTGDNYLSTCEKRAEMVLHDSRCLNGYPRDPREVLPIRSDHTVTAGSTNGHVLAAQSRQEPSTYHDRRYSDGSKNQKLHENHSPL